MGNCVRRETGLEQTDDLESEEIIENVVKLIVLIN